MITVDTNVLVYVFDDTDPIKQAVASRVFNRLTSLDGPIGLQVVGELQSALRRKLKRSPGEAARDARNVMVAFAERFPPTTKAVEEALSHLAAGSLSYWDALLVASARDAGCETMMSEDMQDGALLMSVRIVNPFGAGGEISARARQLLSI